MYNWSVSPYRSLFVQEILHFLYTITPIQESNCTGNHALLVHNNPDSLVGNAAENPGGGQTHPLLRRAQGLREDSGTHTNLVILTWKHNFEMLKYLKKENLLKT